MEAKLLSGVLQNDMHQRLQAGEQLIEYIRGDESNLEEFEEIERLVSGLVGWMNSSNSKVSLSLFGAYNGLLRRVCTARWQCTSTLCVCA